LVLNSFARVPMFVDDEEDWTGHLARRP
jgi:hypothetical protein